MNHEMSTSPESPTMSNSLYNASSTIDDLTHALADFSRAASPDDPSITACCCFQEDCNSLKAWMESKGKLESRLILSAEIGQALLQRHEAYIRRHQHRRMPSHTGTTTEQKEGAQYTVDSRVAELIQENAVLEKRLMQSLVNNEVSEVSNNTIIQELQDARASVTRLTVSAARAAGLEKRMLSALQEKEDMQQERDSEAQRNKVAEGRIAALKERTGKMQLEIKRLQQDLENRRMQRMASSDSILQDARSKLELFQLGRTATLVEETELASVLESLVDEIDTLKRDNMELHTLLSESREDAHALQEEANEMRVYPPSRVTGDRRHSRAFSYASTTSATTSHNHNRGTASIDSRRGQEPLTPKTDSRPLSPESLGPTSKWAFSHLTSEEDHEPVPASPRTHKPLYLLALSRGVQTDDEPEAPTPSPSPLPSSYGDHLSPHEARSESSSVTDSQSPHLSVLVDKVVTLLNRMTQADALTLTSRLKRQHLRGADVGHLSRTTVNAVLSDATNLRGLFRSLLEDDRMTTICTRKDLRGLLKVFRDLFLELGQLRVSLNDVILDPSIAAKLSELALDPAKAEAERIKQRDGGSTSAPGWMAPLSKLFGASAEGNGTVRQTNSPASLTRTNSGRVRTESRPPLRVIPKLRPALSASATTVNVEFSGSGVGRATASTVTPAITIARPTAHTASSDPSGASVSSSVMGIFAGAPAPAVTPDPWVVVPKGPRRVQSSMLNPTTSDALASGTPGVRRFGMRNDRHARRLSRNVDAVIDVESPVQGDDESDAVAPLLERTLRRRGLSDSSIHSTFKSQAAEERERDDDYSYSYTNNVAGPSMFQVLSRKVQILRSVASSTFSPSTSGSDILTTSPPGAPPPATPKRVESRSRETSSRAASPGFAAGMMSSWAANMDTPDMPFYVGSAREESHMPPRKGRDFI